MTATQEAARERCAALREAGKELARRPIDSIVGALDAACARWRDPTSPGRRAAEADLARRRGVPEAAMAVVLDAAFGAWDADAMWRWLVAELGDPAALDGAIPVGSARRMAVPPGLVVVLAAGGIPTTPVADLLAALLVKAAAWIKPPTDGDDLAARFAATLAEIDPLYARAVETAPWRSDDPAGTAILAAADLVVATGRAGTLTALRERLAPDTRLVVHGPRLSAAVVAREALEEDPDRVVAALADDVAFAGQSGCLSPVVAWFEAPGGRVRELVEPIREACEARWPTPPRSRSSDRERALFAEWVALAEIERATGAALATGGNFDHAWSVQARARAEPPAPSPVPRMLALAPVADLADAARLCARKRGLVATIGVAAPEARTGALALALARGGVERVAPLGVMQRPPLAWRRDGRPTLADLIRWFDWEG